MEFYHKMIEIYHEKKKKILENQCINRENGALKLTNKKIICAESFVRFCRLFPHSLLSIIDRLYITENKILLAF